VIEVQPLSARLRRTKKRTIVPFISCETSHNPGTRPTAFSLLGNVNSK